MKRFKTMREEVTIILREKIMRGEIKQGERIKETELADELGVSRGPIREAFRQLEQEGLISYSSRKGCSVKLISAKDSAEIYLLRVNLENLAVRLCKGIFKTDTISEMEKIIDEMSNYSDSDDLLDVIDADQRFHECIVKEANSDKLFEMWSTLNSTNAVIFYALYHSRYSPNEQLSDNHQLVVDAIKSGNTEQICNELQEHYLIVPRNLSRDEDSIIDFDIKL